MRMADDDGGHHLVEGAFRLQEALNRAANVPSALTKQNVGSVLFRTFEDDRFTLVPRLATSALAIDQQEHRADAVT